MKIAIEGCCHGELDKIYETLAYIESRDGIKVDLLLICGDFQAVRNESDLKAMAVPLKYQKMNTFYKYYSGEKKAPVLTVFIGGNHEASNYLQELPYGGWVAPDIYYLGYAGVVRYRGLRIAGLSGIYKPRDYNRGHFEHPPYNDDTKRSCYHIRNVDVFRLKQIKQPIDIFISHDWPRGIYHYGDVENLLRRKRFFADEIAANNLGSMPAEELLYHLKPDYWFSAHLHVKFAALVNHEADDGSSKQTKFLSLDKCLPKRQFLQILDINPSTGNAESSSQSLELDPEWLCILRSTNHLMRVTNTTCYMPGPGGPDRYNFTVNEDELEALNADFGGLFKIPENFVATVSAYNPSTAPCNSQHAAAPQIHINPQTTLLCDMLGITDPYAVFSGHQPFSGNIVDMPAPGGIEDDDTNDSLDVDDRDEGILDDSDFIDSTFEMSAANSTFNPDEISLEDDDNDDVGAGQRVLDPSVEPPVKRLSLSPCQNDAVDYSNKQEEEEDFSTKSVAADASKSLTDDDAKQAFQVQTVVTSLPSVENPPSDRVSEETSVDEEDKPTAAAPTRTGVGLKRRNVAIYATKDSDSSDES